MGVKEFYIKVSKVNESCYNQCWMLLATWILLCCSVWIVITKHENDVDEKNEFWETSKNVYIWDKTSDMKKKTRSLWQNLKRKTLFILVMVKVFHLGVYEVVTKLYFLYGSCCMVYQKATRAFYVWYAYIG